MLISGPELFGLIETGVIECVEPAAVNGTSIDVRLGDVLYYEDVQQGGTVDLRMSPPRVPAFRVHHLSHDPYVMRPGEFVLVQTIERFNLPADLAMEFRLRSSAARAGIGHPLSGWADPGWTGSALTLQIVNMFTSHSIRIHHGMPIGQVVFWRCPPVPPSMSYRERGRYNHTPATTPTRGLT